MAEQVPSIGRVVHYVVHEGPHAGEHRPALIVRVWSDTCVNLVVMMDGDNDQAGGITNGAPLTVWRTSIVYAAPDAEFPQPKNGTWHWPEYVPAK